MHPTGTSVQVAWVTEWSGSRHLVLVGEGVTGMDDPMLQDVADGDPGGYQPVTPTVAPLTDDQGRPLPYVASNDITVFTVFDTGSGAVTSYAYDIRTPDRPVWVLDRFTLDP